MRDLDSAVGRLDNILMSVYVIIVMLIIAVCLVSFSMLLDLEFDTIYPGHSTSFVGNRGRFSNSWLVLLYYHLSASTPDLRYSYSGLSWLIGGTSQEVLGSIIFLFIKHPYDVGDPIVLVKEFYTVKEIRLLSTVFLDANGTSVQAPNNVLNTMVILNLSYLKPN